MSHGFAYAQARFQHRFSRLLDDAAWQRLDSSRSLSGLLEEARQTPLEHWIGGLSKLSDVHHLEHTFRVRLSGLLNESLDWIPKRWRKAAVWTGWLPLLPLLQTAHSQPTPPDWVPAALLFAAPASRPDDDLDSLLARTAPLFPEQTSDHQTITDRWLQHWTSLWPLCPRRERRNLQQLIALLRDHQSQFVAAPADQGWNRRQVLRHALHLRFRRSTLQPAGYFTWLALEALEMERLRGALIQRALFAPLEID